MSKPLDGRKFPPPWREIPSSLLIVLFLANGDSWATDRVTRWLPGRLLEVPALTASLRRNVELAETLGQPASERPLLRACAPTSPNHAALALAPSLTELMRFANTVDFRDLQRG